jgi:hypothetical protein
MGVLSYWREDLESFCAGVVVERNPPLRGEPERSIEPLHVIGCAESELVDEKIVEVAAQIIGRRPHPYVEVVELVTDVERAEDGVSVN